MSPRSKAKQIANRLILQTQLPSINHTQVTNTLSLHTHTRWDLSPTRKASLIANKLMEEHHTCITSDIPNTTNHTRSAIYPNKPIKRPRAHRASENTPKTLIKKNKQYRSNFKLGLLTYSQHKKKTIIKDYILEHNFEIFYIVESCFNNEGDEIPIGNMKPKGYIFKHLPRIAKNRGGGIYT